MRLITVGTGSKGNCYLLDDNGRYLALDCGMKWLDVQIACDFQISLIDAALCTHLHSDHSLYIRSFVRSGIPVFSNDETMTFVSETMGERIKAIPAKKWSKLPNGWKVVPFYVPHDQNAPCFAYIIETPTGRRVLYATDFEYLPFTVKSFNIDTFLIACNHDDDITENPGNSEHFGHIVKGHSSLSVVKDIIELNKSQYLRTIILCHLSAQNATESHMRREIKNVVDGTVKVEVAHKGIVINLS